MLLTSINYPSDETFKFFFSVFFKEQSKNNLRNNLNRTFKLHRTSNSGIFLTKQNTISCLIVTSEWGMTERIKTFKMPLIVLRSS